MAQFLNRISSKEKAIYCALFLFCTIAAVLNMSWSWSELGAQVGTVAPTVSLSDFALQKVLGDASPIFGEYAKTSGPRATWMKSVADETPIVQLNLPGTHDSATWNYSQSTQDALRAVTELNNQTLLPAVTYRCQELPFIDMLDSGIRVFDLRFGLDPTNSTLVFYHGAALQSETGSVENVLFAFYQWLMDHPTEAVFLSFQHERKEFTKSAQQQTYDILTSNHAKQYILQTKNELGTLGEARGKITLLRRFDLSLLPDSCTDAMPGLHFSPTKWTDNSPNIELVYNPERQLTAYIEDYYEIGTADGTGPAVNIQWKYNATAAHLTKAINEHPGSLFWTFASSEHNQNHPPDFPRVMALGNGSATPEGGVNQRLLLFLQQNKGKRLGIVMLDFYDQPGDLVDAVLGL